MTLADEAVRVDGARLVRELEELARFTEQQGGPGAVTRVVFSEADLAARAYVTGLARAAGMTVRVDAVGNTFFRWEGTERSRAAVATGSHLDAIPHAGRYDGTVGVLGAIEAVRALRASGFVPGRSIEVISFTSEEPTRFGIGCLGSRLLSGGLSAEAAAGLRDADGRGLEELRVAAGFTGGLDSVRLERGAYAAFVELHIEQGPELERVGRDVGVVTAIAAPASLRLTVTGVGGHAGAMLMPVRRDALVAAAEMIQAVERAALATGFVDTVATVGMCEVFPGAVNSVPSRVRLSLDVRDVDGVRRDGMLAQIFAACEEIAARRKVAITQEWLNRDDPACADQGLVETIEMACQAEGFSRQCMPSRAYHDALFMARIAPMAMIFIPCRAGVSHRPDEYSSPEQLAKGVAVLARTLAALSLRD